MSYAVCYFGKDYSCVRGLDHQLCFEGRRSYKWNAKGYFILHRKHGLTIMNNVKRATVLFLKINWNHLGEMSNFLTLKCGCTNHEGMIAVETKFCTLAPNICGSCIQNSLHVTPLVSRILTWLLDFFVKFVHLWFRPGGILTHPV